MYNTVRRIIAKIYEIFCTLKKDSSCLFETLYKYDIKEYSYDAVNTAERERPRKRSRPDKQPNVADSAIFSPSESEFYLEILEEDDHQYLINRDSNVGPSAQLVVSPEPEKLLQLRDKTGFLPLSQHCVVQSFLCDSFHQVSS